LCNPHYIINSLSQLNRLDSCCNYTTLLSIVYHLHNTLAICPVKCVYVTMVCMLLGLIYQVIFKDRNYSLQIA
jgi:hypothetical protein